MLCRLSPILAVLALAACGGGGGTTSTETSTSTTTTATTETTETTETTQPETTSFRIYLLRDGRVQPVARTAAKTAAVANAAFQGLISGATKAEQQLGLSTEVPSVKPWSLALDKGVVRLETATEFNRLALAQIVYTLTQFPTVKAVEIAGMRYTRADFEDETPIILVESPLPFQTVKSPLRATGTANTFEATFNYDLIGPDGKVISTHFVTATSGSGQRGTFDFSVPFSVERPGDGKLIVYELSAKDGSRIHEGEIPIRLEQ
jgi:hypothetical protein